VNPACLRSLTLLTGSLVLSACASGSAAKPSDTPEPQPGAPTPTTPAASGGHGPAITYAPIRSAPFRFERHDSLTFEYEGGATQQQARDRVAFLRVSLAQAPTPGEYRVTVLLDSLQAMENGAPVAPDSLLAVQGTEWTATLAPGTGLSPFKANRASTLGDEVQGRLPLLFPTLPTGGVREGMAWTDTTQYEVAADAFPGTEEAVVTYRASEAEVGSREAIALESSGTYTRSGTRMQADQEMKITASGNRKGIHRIGLDGVLLGAEGSDAGEMTISVPAVGQTVPVKQSGNYTITSARAR
jgi:hypothetical protein